MLHPHRVATRVTGRVGLSLFVLFALTLLAAPAQAAPVQINVRSPFELDTFNACTGELVTITGQTHLLGHLVEDSSGSSHLRGLVQLQGTGVSAAGTRYVSSGTANLADNNFEATGNGALEGTVVLNATLISNGSTLNSLERQLIHLTINANGELTAAVQQQDSTCIG